jgi:YD repeat-containing protein
LTPTTTPELLSVTLNQNPTAGNHGDGADGAYTFIYDPLTANLTDVTWMDEDGTSHEASYEYDLQGRVLRQVFFDGTQRGFEVDALGRIARVDTARAENRLCPARIRLQRCR